MKNLKIFTQNIEEVAVNQINELLDQDAFCDCNVRIMPDVHAGKGCVIGFTANLGDKVIPNIVGVDIGCGMSWVQTTLKESEIDLAKIDEIIRQNVPSGMNVREANKILESSIDLHDLYCFDEIRNVENRIERSLGTLGGGNNFIEIDKDKNDNLVFVVHSGSRNLGKQVCEIYQNKAIEYCSCKNESFETRTKAIDECKKQGNMLKLPQILKEIDQKFDKKENLPRDLCYIEGELREHYLHDMRLCQKWASENRANMLNEILKRLKEIVAFDQINRETIHNYIGDDNIVRKGAISAYEGEIVLIPMNMRDGCIIARGKGNDDWNQSAPHGAGRIMSRMQAKSKLKIEQYKDEMKGIFSTSICAATIDEAPMAYKPIADIVDNINDTVEVLEIIKPIYNYKAKD